MKKRRCSGLGTRLARPLLSAVGGIVGRAGDWASGTLATGLEESMPLDVQSLPVTKGRFRERRSYLSPEAFADPGDGIQPPTDLIDRDAWVHLMDLPTDVLLQTTDHFGSTFCAMRSLSHMWI